MILCKFCGKYCEDRRVLSFHLTKSHNKQFTSDLEKERMIVDILFGKEYVDEIIEDYLNEKYCAYNLPIDIIKLLFLMGIKRTSKEERATERYKTTYLNSIKEKYGEHIENISQVEEIKNKKYETVSKNYDSYDAYKKQSIEKMRDGYKKYITPEKRKENFIKSEKTCFERYGHKNFGQGDIAKIKAKISRKKIIDSWTYEERLERTSKARCAVNSRGGYSSKPEKRVRKILIDMDIEYKYNVHLWNYNWDMVFENIIIEVQGTMWHAKPEFYKENDLIMGKILAKTIWEKDKRKKEKANIEGYHVIEIWEDEINNSSDEQLYEIIKERLIKHGYKFYD